MLCLLPTRGLWALHHGLVGCATLWLIVPCGTYFRHNFRDFIKCSFLGRDVLGTAARIENSAFVFLVFSTKYAVMRCLFWSRTLSIIPPIWLSLWFKVWRHLVTLTYHCGVRCFGSNQQSCVQGRLAPHEVPGCWLRHPPGDRWRLQVIVEPEETVTIGYLKLPYARSIRKWFASFKLAARPHCNIICSPPPPHPCSDCVPPLLDLTGSWPLPAGLLGLLLAADSLTRSFLWF